MLNNSSTPPLPTPQILIRLKRLTSHKITSYTSYYNPLLSTSKNQLISQCLPSPSAASPSSRSQRKRVKNSSLRNTAPCLKKHSRYFHLPLHPTYTYPRVNEAFRTARHTFSTSRPARHSPTSAPRVSLWPSLRSSRTRRIWCSTIMSAQGTQVSRKWPKPCTRAL